LAGSVIAAIIKSVADARETDRTAYEVYGIAAEANRRKFRVWNASDHVTMQVMAIPDTEISAVRFFAVY